MSGKLFIPLPCILLALVLISCSECKSITIDVDEMAAKSGGGKNNISQLESSVASFIETDSGSGNKLAINRKLMIELAKHFIDKDELEKAQETLFVVAEAEKNSEARAKRRTFFVGK